MNETVGVAANPAIRITDERIEAAPPDRLTFRMEGVLSMSEGLLSRFSGSTLQPSAIELLVDEGATVEIDLADGAELRLESADVGLETAAPDDLASGIDALEESVPDPTDAVDADPTAVTDLDPTDVATTDADSADVATTDADSADVATTDADSADVATTDADSTEASRTDADPAETDPEAVTDASPAALAFTVEGSIRDVPEETVAALAGVDPSIEALEFDVEDAVRGDGGARDDVLLDLSLFGYGITIRRDGSILVGSVGSAVDLGLS